MAKAAAKGAEGATSTPPLGEVEALWPMRESDEEEDGWAYDDDVFYDYNL
jgi:hypothetical protein